MYDKIKNPLTNRFVNVNSHTGKSIIQNYINVLNGGAHSMQTRSKSVNAKQNWKKIKKKITRSDIDRVLNRIQQTRIKNNSYVGGGKGFIGAASPAAALIIGLRMIAPIQAMENLPGSASGSVDSQSMTDVSLLNSLLGTIQTPEEVGALAICALGKAGLHKKADDLENGMVEVSFDDILKEVNAEEPGFITNFFNWLHIVKSALKKQAGKLSRFPVEQVGYDIL